MEYSLCILHHGDPTLTAECLRSTMALSPPPVERLVVWNDSRGPAREDLDSARGEGVRLLETGRNLGFTGGANFGVRHAFEHVDVRALFLLNNDTVVQEASVEPLTKVLVEGERVGIVGPRILQHGSQKIWHDGGRIEWPSGRPRSDRYGLDRSSDPSEDPRDVEFVCGCAPLIRREAFESVGGFDERFFVFFEDVDLSLRMQSQGWRRVHAPRAVVYHRGSQALEARPEVARYYRLRNRLLLLEEHSPNAFQALGARRRLRFRSFMSAGRRYLTGRTSEARAIRAALADAKARRWGEWPRSPKPPEP